MGFIFGFILKKVRLCKHTKLSMAKNYIWQLQND